MIDSTDLVNETIIENVITSSMSISSAELKAILVKLVESEYVSLDLIEGKEVYSLDPTFKRLANLLELDEEKEKKDEGKQEIIKTVSFLEKEYQKTLSSNELELVKHWIYVDKYDYSSIKDATLECLKLGKKQIKYVDIVLRKDEKQEEKVAVDDDLDKLFKKVYGKVKRNKE